MLLSKKQGGSGVGPHFWQNDGDVVEVPDALGMELLSIRGNDFEHVDSVPEPADTPEPDAETGGTEDDGASGDADPNAGDADPEDATGDADSGPADGKDAEKK